MDAVTTSAPGKLFLIGEYAVVEYGPAIIAVVAQRAYVRISRCRGKAARVLIIADSCREACIEDVPILASVIEELESRQLFTRDMLAGCRIELDTQAFYRDTQKLGLGSSAALTVAILQALFSAPRDEQYFDLAIACHRRLQGGLGSGADVATALSGRLSRYQRDCSVPETVSLPPDLRLLFVWSGQSADTSAFLKKLAEFKACSLPVYDRQIAELSKLSSQSVAALNQGATGDFIRFVGAFDRKLEEFSRVSRLGFYSDVHQCLYQLVSAEGATYKPSGAGGGDFGVVATDSDEVAARVVASLTKAGYDPSLACLAINEEG